ncbi:hypothetical protein [Halovenus sp. HT40]|uniref:hypothetical protein n=1 Tax=Halovenus sp. HT40 TaxID=3126691 RepID=UPI00300E9D2B
MDITSRHTLVSAFAETYAKADEPHPLRQFEQYDRVMAHRSHDPDTGGRVLSRRLDLPEGRINGWLRGSQPRGYSQAETIDELGWFDLSWTGDLFSALNELLAWIYSSGGIRSGWEPHFIFDTAEMRERIETLCDRAALNYQATRTGHDDKPSEIRVASPSAPAGRFFHALGAPKGRKADATFGLPNYLSLAPEEIRREFAARYIANRGSERPNYAADARSIREQRPQAYLEQLRGLFASLTDEEIRRGGEPEIHLSGGAVETICAPAKTVVIDTNSQS